MLDLLPTALAALAGLTLVFSAVQLFRIGAMGREFPELRADSYPLSADEDAADAASISVVVAAKDEAQAIEGCVRSILAQAHSSLELIVADDRSADGTPRVLRRLSAELGDRLRVVTIAELPDGWGGQNHALHRGVSETRGEWLCFTDADCRFDSPRTLAVALADATAHGAEFLSILPRMEAPTFWEKIYVPLCTLVLLIRLRIVSVNDPASDAGYANGAFILIRRDAYDRLGGHERVRGVVNDDVRLAQLAKREGVTLRITGNVGLCRTRMYETIPGAFRGWSRNFWGTIQDPTRLAAAFMWVMWLFIVPWALAVMTGALWAAGDPDWALAAGSWALVVLVMQVGLVRLYGAFGIHPFWSLVSLPGALFVAAIVARATLRAAGGRGTTWEGAHYAQPEATPATDPSDEARPSE